MALSPTVTFSGDLAERLQRLAQMRQQNVNTLLEALLNQAWIQYSVGTNDSPGMESGEVIPRPESFTAKIWGALGKDTQAEIDEVFAYDYDYELSQR